jgi:cytochrome oxidase Cu insertion factor (SCO1/SenC/PrrC family)
MSGASDTGTAAFSTAGFQDADRYDYTVDHSAFVYLMGRDGRYLSFFRQVRGPGD